MNGASTAKGRRYGPLGSYLNERFYCRPDRRWHLVEGLAVQGSAKTLFTNATPLLEKESHFFLLTLQANLLDPCFRH